MTATVDSSITNNVNEHTIMKDSTSTSLYSKLLDVGLNDTMINKAITHISPARMTSNPHVIKEGHLGKESVHFKKVRQRWMVLKGKYLYSYKDKQIYEDPTEIFDLKLYRTARMVDDAKISGQFELISMKQERRIFIAANKNEMNEWIKYIKKVILFSKEYSEKCRSLRSCLALRRLVNVLRLHACYSQYNDICLRYIGSYKQLLNDYHHVLGSHLNEAQPNCINSNKSYELIHKIMNFYCNIDQCSCYIRNNRIREFEENETDHRIMVYRDILDTIHCTLIHSFDSGLNIRHKHLHAMIPNDHNHHSDGFDAHLAELKRHLLLCRKRFQKVRKQNHRIRNNKFYCKAFNDKPLAPLRLNEEAKHADNIIADHCEFGQKFVYWEHYKSSPFYIYQKYDNLKLEIMDNIFCPLEISKYIQTHIKSMLLLRNSDAIRKARSDGNNPYKIGLNASLTLEHLMALIFYTDFDILSLYFVSTFSPISRTESRHEVMTRHRQFCIWSKLLHEAVQCFGHKVNESHIDTYFVCVPMQYFDRFMLKWNEPTSITTNLSIATLFCPSNGIILELKKTACNTGASLRYFDCSLVSSFSAEKELLFIGGTQSLQLSAIRNMKHNECYRQFIAPFMKFMRIMNGINVLQLLWNEDYAIISNLISSKTIYENPNYSSYIIKCFDRFCEQQKVITINLKWLYNFRNNFVHLECCNLLLFDNLSILFKNCEVIHCKSTAIINSLYLSLLAAILEHININKGDLQKKKLKKIVLHGIMLKVSNADFAKYKSSLYETVQWIVERTDKYTLTLRKSILI